MPRSTLVWRLGLAFAAVAAVTALLAAALLGVTWQRQFTSYVRRGLQAQADGVAQSVAEAYAAAGGWQDLSLQFSHSAMMSGLRVRILDADGKVIEDTADVMGGALTLPESDVGPVASSRVTVGGVDVGAVRVSPIAPGGLLTERDRQFVRAAFRGLLIAALIAVCLSSIAGAWYARSIVRPINAVTEVAAALRAGRRDARTGMRGEDAVAVLGATLDQMADAVEADREFERRLTADVAHELRTPLQAIQATVEAMQDGVLPMDVERLGVVREETMRLGRLTGHILELARLERGEVPFRSDVLDPAWPVSRAIEAHRALIESSGLELVEDVREGLGVRGDADRLTQAVGNLLSNAARYTEPGGTVVVRLSADEGEALIEVSDTGIGVAEEDSGRVFTRFWRSAGARELSKGGLGIGLAVVKEIVDRHGGGVTVAAREGGGTTFSLRLPLAG
ncbi:MAG: HAMP domain-containing sensor histidine kinase [Coriobacteriia bacterium]